MKLTFKSFLFTLTVFTACSDNEAVLPDEPKENPQSIKEVVAEVFPEGNVFIGAATQHKYFGTKVFEVFDREFSYATPGIMFKQSIIHPEPGKYNYEKADDWVQHCRENNQVIRMHAPISPQCSQWARTDSRTPEELETNLVEYMTALCKRYNGIPEILWLDVVNETIERSGEWFGPKPGNDQWENPWPIIGYDESHPLRPPLYIKKAFEIANEFAPDLKLIINQHGGLEKESWVKMKQLVAYLRENNLRVDGIGWQAHVDLGWEKIPGNLDYLKEIILWCQSNNLEFHITEFNVWLKGDDARKHNEQANTFEAIAKVLLDNHNNKVTSINFWGISAIDVNAEEWDGSMWDADYEPKPAYYTILELLKSYK
ncbi:endo-1,4-beta-xylanase [Draconibacterium mangrovi]|uniref:endo-1,4-beta-xylanase n=1 Tax=Draconibacterium mangrovi TaxID=2697469 RepID=UPI0013D1DBC4|nr:endo-1,4-beta-xylanase [Draconibacterium mangrovi]